MEAVKRSPEPELSTRRPAKEVLPERVAMGAVPEMPPWRVNPPKVGVEEVRRFWFKEALPVRVRVLAARLRVPEPVAMVTPL